MPSLGDTHLYFDAINYLPTEIIKLNKKSFDVYHAETTLTALGIPFSKFRPVNP